MQTRRLVLLGLICAATVLPAAFGQEKNSQPASEAALAKVIAMQSVPDGRYKANIKYDGNHHSVVIKVEAGSAEYAETANAVLKGMKGQFQHVGNGVFIISMANNQSRATQFWVFRPDGSAAIKEIPDRGENQVAVLINNGSN